jgi:REP element-mobilizing transposase RayT
VTKVDKVKELPKRKHPRLGNYDYNSAGAYFVTICTQNRQCVLSRPTIMDIVCAYKSLTTRECKKNGFDEKLFQNSFYDHVIRDREDYDAHARYIAENPMRWSFDELYIKE